MKGARMQKYTSPKRAVFFSSWVGKGVNLSGESGCSTGQKIDLGVEGELDTFADVEQKILRGCVADRQNLQT